CEYGFITGHEDLCNVGIEPGNAPDPILATNWDHGTAVLGEMVAQDNGYGCEGLVPDAGATLYPEFEAGTNRSVAAVAAALVAAQMGDVVLLEMQTQGPDGGTVNGANGYGPADYDNNLWVVINAGCASKGVIVVATGGNGQNNGGSPNNLD